MKSISLVILFLTLCVNAKSQSFAPYSVIVVGAKQTPSEIKREDLGKQCSVYSKANVGAGAFNGIPAPEGMLTRNDKVLITTGELNAIGKDYIEIYAYYDARREKGAKSSRISLKDIDYIIFKKQES